MRTILLVIATVGMVAALPGRGSAQCALAPDAGCKHTTRVPSKTRIWIHEKTPAGFRNSIVWRWRHGDATSLADFGDPRSVDAYALCLYDATPRLLFQGRVPAGGICGNGRPCWRQVAGRYYLYRNGQATPDGLTKIQLVPGTQGAANVIVKGRGAHLALPTLPLTPPVLVQLQASNGSCWEASYSTSVANDAHKFIAGAD